MRKIFLLLLIVTGYGVQAQQLNPRKDSIVWISSKAIAGQTEIALSNTFTTYGGKYIEWTQPDGDEINLYEVTGVEDTWNEVQNEGSIEFKVKLRDRDGVILFYHDSNSVKVRLKFIRDGVDMVPYEFIVTEIKKNK